MFDQYFCLDKPLYDTPGIQRHTISTCMLKNRFSIVAVILMPIPGMGNIMFFKEVKKMALDLLAHGIAVRISREDNRIFLLREEEGTKQQLPQLETYNEVKQQN